MSILPLSAQSSDINKRSLGWPILIESISSDSLWQVNKPGYSVFTSAYPINMNSSFILKVKVGQMYSTFLNSTFEWTQKMDCESNRDGGIIEYSIDNQQTWVDISKDTIMKPLLMYNARFDTLYDGSLGFSNSDTAIQRMGLSWSYLTSSSRPYYGGPSTFYLRFTFKSDSIETNQDGWLLKNFSVDYSILNSLHLNRSGKKASIRFKEKFLNHSFIIKNSYGNEILNKHIKSTEKLSIDISSLGKGMYTCLIENEEGQLIERKELMLGSRL